MKCESLTEPATGTGISVEQEPRKQAGPWSASGRSRGSIGEPHTPDRQPCLSLPKLRHLSEPQCPRSRPVEGGCSVTRPTLLPGALRGEEELPISQGDQKRSQQNQTPPQASFMCSEARPAGEVDTGPPAHRTGPHQTLLPSR